jgi:hypothetical protein
MSHREFYQAGSGFFSIDNLKAREERNINAYVPDSNMARALNLWVRDAAPGRVFEPIAACAPSCEVRPAKLPMPGLRPSSNRSSESLNNNALCANFAPVD